MYAVTPPQSAAPSSALRYSTPYNSFLSTFTPKLSTHSPRRFTQAFRSEVQLLQCTMATGIPSGVVTMSISSCTFSIAFSSTTMAKIEVPAETLPVRTATLLVATMPVPASPSGGHMGAPGCKVPVGSSNFAPSAVRTPAGSPATSTFGRMSRIFQSKLCKPSN